MLGTDKKVGNGFLKPTPKSVGSNSKILNFELLPKAKPNSSKCPNIKLLNIATLMFEIFEEVSSVFRRKVEIQK